MEQTVEIRCGPAKSDAGKIMATTSTDISWAVLTPRSENRIQIIHVALRLR